MVGLAKKGGRQKRRRRLRVKTKRRRQLRTSISLSLNRPTQWGATGGCAAGCARVGVAEKQEEANGGARTPPPISLSLSQNTKKRRGKQ